MKILLLAATQMEVQPFLLTVPKCDVLIGGVGVTATAYHLTKKLSHHHYDLVVQAGVAGTFTQDLALGEVVTVKSDTFGDLGVMDNDFKSVQDMGFNNEVEWLENKNSLLEKLAYEQVKAITVNTIHTNLLLLDALQAKWKPDIESMEGAALHYVCQQQQTPYLQLRSISNQVGVRDKAQWKMKEAITNLNEAIQKLFQSMAQ